MAATVRRAIRLAIRHQQPSHLAVHRLLIPRFLLGRRPITTPLVVSGEVVAAVDGALSLAVFGTVVLVVIAGVEVNPKRSSN